MVTVHIMISNIMKTQEEIEERQARFVSSYSFPKTDVFPKMKAWTAAINASVRTRKYPVYSNVKKNRADAVCFWKTELERLGEKYKNTQQDKQQFINDVYSLQGRINSSMYRSCFTNDRIRVGQCQKSLSIFLKWMWCQGELAGVPPVCPIDGQVLAECRKVLKKKQIGSKPEILDTHIAWSNMDCREQYERLVLLTEKVARAQGETRPCVWELFAVKEPLK